MRYRVTLYSKNGDYPFRGIYWNQEIVGNELRLPRGLVVLDKCVGVEYDTHVKSYTAPVRPITTFSSDEDGYFFRTDVLLDYMRTPIS